MVELARQNKAALSVADGFNPSQVASIAAEVAQMTYDFAGGGRYGVDKEVRIKDGTTLEHEVQDYPGLPFHPFTWEDSVEKFDQLVTGRIDGYLSTVLNRTKWLLASVLCDLRGLLFKNRFAFFCGPAHQTAKRPFLIQCYELTTIPKIHFFLEELALHTRDQIGQICSCG